MWRNDKADAATGTHADQNYAREVTQLFTIGLVQLERDGTVGRDAGGMALPTYGQPEVEALANVLTGWAFRPTDHSGEEARLYDQDHVDPIEPCSARHDGTAKTIVGGVVVPAGR